jgi:competence protein ComEA
VSALLRAAAAAVLLLAAAPALAKKPLAPGERLDLNRATAAELMRLPGVGRKRAEAIVAHRQRHPFRTVDDVVAVKGVSPAWVSRLKPHLTVSPAGTTPHR